MDRSGAATIRALLFTDVVGSTALRSRLGDDEADRLRRDHDDLVGPVVAGHGGEVLRWTGDGIKASFPTASAAVLAALDVQRAVARYGRSADAAAPFRVRAGVAVGEVTREDGDDHGVAVIEGARLEPLAEPGEVLVTDLVRRLGGRRLDLGVVRFEDVGLRTLKGLDDPVAVVRVVDLRPDVTVVPLPRGLTVDSRFPLVGRAKDLDVALERWNEATDGVVSSVLVSGQPGMGKSRLLAHVATRTHDDGALVLAGQCDADLAVPYQPFIAALGEVPDLDDALATAIADGRGALGPLFPSGRSGRADDLGPSARFDMFEAVADLLGRLAGERPVVLLLEDLHWASSSTVQLARHLMAGTAPTRLMIVGTFRAEEVAAPHPLQDLLAEAQTSDRAVRIDLDALEPDEIGELIAGRVPSAPSGAIDDLARHVWAESGGSPFFVCEILDHLSSTGDLERILGRGGDARLPIPDSVRDIVGHRLGRLPPGGTDLLSSAAVIGQSFDLGVLAELSGLHEEQALLLLEEAERGALVHEVDAGRFAFGHAIVRTTLIDRLSATRLALVHRRIAEAFEARRPDDHDELAHHWIEARDEARATEHLRRAASRDLEALAYESAVDRFRQVLDHHARRPPADPVDEARAWLGLGLAQRALGLPEYLAAIQEAGRRARRLGDADVMAEAAIASLWPGTFFTSVGATDMTLLEMAEDALEGLAEADPRRVRVMSTMASHLTFDPDTARRDGLLADALDLARRSRDPELVGSVLVTEHLATWTPATMDRRAEIAAELARLARASGSAEIEFFAGFFTALGAAERVDVAGAQRILDGLDDVVDRSQNFYHRFLVDRLALSLDILAGRPDVQAGVDELAARYAETHADTDGTWALQTGFLAHVAGRLAGMVPAIEAMIEGSALSGIWVAPYGVALLASGDRDGAMGVLDAMAEPPFDYFWTTVTQARAELALDLGRIDLCPAFHAALAPYAGRLGITASGTLFYGLIDTTLGLLAHGLGRTDEAVARLEGAIADADRIGAPYEAVRARRGLLCAQGRPDPTLLATALDLATTHGHADELARLRAIPV